MSDKILITRNQLAKFLPNPETIKAFEHLFKLSTVQTPLDVENIAIDASSAMSSAEEAISIASVLQRALELVEKAPNSATNEDLIAVRNIAEYAMTLPPLSDNQTPVIDYIQFKNTFSSVKTAGQLHWSYTYGDLQFVHLGGLIQNLGIDNIAHVYNNTGSTITKGSAVSFNGVSGSSTIIKKFIANGTISSLYIVGVASEDILNNAEGHATISGFVRDVNASGSLYTETWANGDLLYTSPTITGGLTKVKPTAPNVCIPMAIVLNNSATVGSLYIRTTLEQQLYYGGFTDSTNKTAAAINTAYAITFNTTSASNGISLGTPTSRIIATNAGLYEFSFSTQLTSGSASAKTVWFWPRKNGTDIPNSAMKASVSGSNVTVAVSRSMFFSLNAGDYIEAMWATNDTNVTLEAAASTAFAPATPSAIMTVSQISQ